MDYFQILLVGKIFDFHLSSHDGTDVAVVYGNGNNKEDGCEGVHYKNVFGSYFHGPILSRNANLAYRLVSTALKNKYGKDLSLPAYEEILSLEQPEEYADVKSKAPAEQ